MKKVLITGANRGIGFELVKRFTAAGGTVFATCRQPNRAHDLQAWQKGHPGQVAVVPLDVSSDESVKEARSIVAAQTSHLDVLVNNAGINYQHGFAKIQLERHARYFQC